MGPKKDNNKSAKSTDKSVKPKGKNAKNTSDTKTINKPKGKVKKPKEKVNKPKEKAIQKKINFPVTPKTRITTSPTASTSFSTAVNVQDITTTCSTPPPQTRPPQKRNVDSDSPFSTTSSLVFTINSNVSKRDTLDDLPRENLLSTFIADAAIHQENLPEPGKRKKVSSDDSSGQTKVKRKQKQESARKTIDSTHRGDNYDFDEISSDQVKNVTKTTGM